MLEGVEVDERVGERRVAGFAAPLARCYAWGLLSEFSLTAGIWILYLQHRGFSLAEIGLAESVFHLAPLTLELLTGSLADLFGRKWSLALSSLCLTLSSLLMLQATSLWIVLPAMYLNGAFYAFRSGAQEALLYDSLAERGSAARFTGVLGKLYSATYLVIAATTWLGGWLADRGFTLPYLLTAGFGLGGVFLAASLREPERTRSGHRNPARIVADAIGIVRAHSDLPLLLIYAAALWTLSALIGLYAQAVLSEMGLPPSRVGLVIGATLLFTSAGAWFAGRLATRGAFQRWTLVVSLGSVAAALGLGSQALPFAVGTYFVAEFFFGVYEPMLSGRINGVVGSTERATVLSLQGFLYSATMIWAFPLFGAAASRFGWLAAYAGASAVVLALLAALAWRTRFGRWG